MTIRYLSISDFATHTGLARETVRYYWRGGRLPEPDAVIGLDSENGRPVSGWLPETVDYWMTHRLGRGYRSDLKK